MPSATEQPGSADQCFRSFPSQSALGGGATQSLRAQPSPPTLAIPCHSAFVESATATQAPRDVPRTVSNEGSHSSRMLPPLYGKSDTEYRYRFGWTCAYDVTVSPSSPLPRNHALARNPTSLLQRAHTRDRRQRFVCGDPVRRLHWTLAKLSTAAAAKDNPNETYPAIRSVRMRLAKSSPEYRRRNHVSGAAKQNTPIARKAMTWCNFIANAPNAAAQ